MKTLDAINAARDIIDDLDITSEDENREFYHALVEDEAFGAACHNYQSVALYTNHEHATAHETVAKHTLKYAIRDHAQRVRGEVE